MLDRPGVLELSIYDRLARMQQDMEHVTTFVAATGADAGQLESAKIAKAIAQLVGIPEWLHSVGRTRSAAALRVLLSARGDPVPAKPARAAPKLAIESPAETAKRLDALSRQRALTDAESRLLERCLRSKTKEPTDAG